MEHLFSEIIDQLAQSRLTVLPIWYCPMVLLVKVPIGHLVYIRKFTIVNILGGILYQEI